MRRLNSPLLALVAVTLSSLDASAGGPLVDIRSVDPTIIVELRYAGRNNLVGYPLYPQGTSALARPEVASGLAAAQACICCRSQCEMQVFGDCAPSGGISRLLIGKNTCRTRRHEPHRCTVPSGRVSYDGRRAGFSICHVERSRDISICFLSKLEIPPLRSE